MIIHSHGACYVELIVQLVFLPMAFLSPYQNNQSFVHYFTLDYSKELF